MKKEVIVQRKIGVLNMSEIEEGVLNMLMYYQIKSEFRFLYYWVLGEKNQNNADVEICGVQQKSRRFQFYIYTS